MSENVLSVKDVKEGSFVMVEGEPCKVLSLVKSKAGKHGSAKVRMEVVGLFDEKKRQLLKLGDDSMSSPVIEKRSGQIISVSGNMAQIMDLEDYSTFDAIVPPEMASKIQPSAEIGYWRFDSRILLK